MNTKIRLLFLFLVLPLFGDSTASSNQNQLNQSLFNALYRGKDIANIQELLWQGADVNARDATARTPLIVASEDNKLTPIAKLLLLAHVQVNLKNRAGYTALHYAAGNGNDELVKELLLHEAEVNVQNSNGETPLILLAQYKGNSTPTDNLLLNARAQTNIQDKHGNTALHYATQKGNLELAKKLIAHGANTTIKNKAGESPLDQIIPREASLANARIATLLINNGIKSFLNERKSLEEGRSFYNATIMLIDRYKDLLATGEKEKLSSQLSKLSKRYKLTTPFHTQLKRYSPYDLLKVFDVSVVDDKALKNPADALPNIPLGAPDLTQTEAYLSIPELRSRVSETFALDLARYPKLIKRIIEQEKKFKNYDVFYHGQKRDFIVFYDTIKEILNWLKKIPDTAEFEYLRLPEGQSKELEEYIALGDTINDNEPWINKTLLPVNLSLFGNTRNPGECTFNYFLNNDNIAPPKNLLNIIFTKLDLDTSYIPKILDLLADIDSPTGNLLQIFIPRDRVNHFVYASVAYGVPLNTKIAQKDSPLKPIKVTKPKPWYKFYNEITTYDPKTIDMATYLTIYRNNPQAIDPTDMDQIEGRINITHDFLLEPNSGVKIFRYNTVRPDKLLEYHQKLRDIIKEVMEDWKRRNTTPAHIR